MSDMKCPFCQQKLECCGSYIYGTKKLGCANCGLSGDSKLFSELIHTRKDLEQSEICCTEWEKQALDYKAENIALSGELERTHKALDIATKCINWVIDTFQKGLEHEAEIVGCCELSLWNIEGLEQKE